jgi:hypothetical protein
VKATTLKWFSADLYNWLAYLPALIGLEKTELDVVGETAMLRCFEPPAPGSKGFGTDEMKSATSRCDDPITLQQAADLLLVSRQTIYNRGTRTQPLQRPEPRIRHRGRSPDVFSYRELRPWLLQAFPEHHDRLRETYQEAKQFLIAQVST